MIEMIVDRVQVSLMSQHRLVVLRDAQEERYLPIWIGAFESEAITLELQGMLRERPLTHDLLKATITKMGGAVRHIFINNLSKDVFYATINIDVNGETIDIDSRPSDAIALAVRLNAPIYVDKLVMDKAGIRPDRNVEPEILGFDDDLADGDEASAKVDEAKLSAFADFVDTLNLDDFDEDE